MSDEIDPMDRIYDLVTELCEADCDPREIMDTARDAIREWRQMQAEPSPAKPPDGGAQPISEK